ncbi:MAG TPA: peptide chain release factor 2 [Verrucomicrobiae bacterium]|nr:peptide chain release factor 2 [Verrucomicrobiae bacterium]
MPSVYNRTLVDVSGKLSKLRSYLDPAKRKESLALLKKKTESPDFWADPAAAQKILKQINAEEKMLSTLEKLEKKSADLQGLLDLAAEEKDEATRTEAEREIEELSRELSAFELLTLLSGEDDAKNAILTIHPGAGGTESQDWAQMLLRMYTRFLERRGFKVEMLDFQAGDEAGIKDVTLEVTGEYAYGFLKSESGVHRLVRISPFDANKRRHTSFASVFVLPEIEDKLEVEIKDEDIKLDTFRASGAGGQHVNKTSSAVRITHLPTGIIVQCQTERSQHKNRESAMKVLRARLYQYHREKEEAKLSEMEKTKKKIEWGSQIRSYVFQPYTLVKDHRTGFETSDVEGVMDGEIDKFIEAYLSKPNNQPMLEEKENEPD